MEIQSNTNAASEPVVVQPSIFKKVAYYEVDYYDLEKLIQEEFGISDFSFVDAQECGNDTQFSMEAEIVTDEFLLNLHKEDLEKAKEGDWVYKTSTLLNELAMRNKILTGKYLINVSW